MRTVLIIEDEPVYMSYLSSMIGGNVTLMLAFTLEEGISALKHRKADVVLLDLGLPDSNREETLHAFKLAYPTVPVVVISGLGDPEFIEKCILENCYGYIVKSRTDTKEHILHEIEEAIEYSGINQALNRAKAAIKN